MVAITDLRAVRKNGATRVPGVGTSLCRWACAPPPGAPRQGLVSIHGSRTPLRCKAPVVPISIRGLRSCSTIGAVCAVQATRCGSNCCRPPRVRRSGPVDLITITHACSATIVSVSRSALSPGDTPKDIRANTDGVSADFRLCALDHASIAVAYVMSQGGVAVLEYKLVRRKRRPRRMCRGTTNGSRPNIFSLGPPANRPEADAL